MVATSSISKNTHLKLLEFLQNVETSKWIKGRIEDYFHWLDKEDVKSIADLQEAVHDDEYLKNDLHEGNWVVGIKGFKLEIQGIGISSTLMINLWSIGAAIIKQRMV